MKPPSRPRPALGKTAPKPPAQQVPTPAKRKQATPTKRSGVKPASTPTQGTGSAQSPVTPKSPASPVAPKSPASPVAPSEANSSAVVTDITNSTRVTTGPRSVVSVGLQARLAERQAIEQSRRRRKWYWIGGGIALLALMLWLVFFSPMFALDPDRIVVTGTADTVDSSAVVELVDANHGVPLPRLNTTVLRLQIKDVRGVQDATIRRDWPRGLTIDITARQPVAAVPVQDGDGFILLDSEAVQVGRSKKAPGDLPVISVPVSGDNQVVLESVLVVLEAIPADLSAQVQKVSANTQDDITLRLRGGGTVKWGDSSANALKAEVLAVLREQVGDSKDIDVSAPSAPITW